MHDRLIGYLLEALEVEEKTYVEQAINANQEVRSQLEILRISLTPLESDRTQIDAPAGLAIRTCERIRQLRNNP